MIGQVRIMAGPRWWHQLGLIRAKHGDKGRFDKPHIFKCSDFWVGTQNGRIKAGGFSYATVCYDLIGWQSRED